MGVCLPIVISMFHRHLGKADAVRVATQLAHSGSSRIVCQRNPCESACAVGFLTRARRKSNWSSWTWMRVYMGRDSQALMVQLWWGGRSCIVETSGPPDTRAYEPCTGPRRSHTPPHICDLFTLKQIFGSLWFATCPCPKHTSLASE